MWHATLIAADHAGKSWTALLLVFVQLSGCLISRLLSQPVVISCPRLKN